MYCNSKSPFFFFLFLTFFLVSFSVFLLPSLSFPSFPISTPFSSFTSFYFFLLVHSFFILIAFSLFLVVPCPVQPYSAESGLEHHLFSFFLCILSFQPLNNLYTISNKNPQNSTNHAKAARNQLRDKTVSSHCSIVLVLLFPLFWITASLSLFL